jgi:serine/threonine protein kinase
VKGGDARDPTEQAFPMAAQLGVHPSADALRDFASGRLDDVAAAAVMSHLDGCPDCCRAVAELSCDDFLGRLRHVLGPGSTPAPADTPADAARAPVAYPAPDFIVNPQYEVLHELGRGGMGVVYLARNKLLDRLEVLKVVNRTLLDRPGAVDRFLREIRSAARLNHPNVVAAYSAVPLGEALAFAMEYVEGEDLARLVQTQGPLPVERACDYVRQAALGLQHAFERNMVHRDMKPQNLMLVREGQGHTVKVLDFGLAKVTCAENDDTDLTGYGVMLGTPDYVAPEQTLDAANADIRADVYSLGCTLYFLLAGAPPFQGRSRYEVLHAHQSTEARPVNLLRPGIPEGLAAVVRKAMAKDPAERYQTPQALVQALAPFVGRGAEVGAGRGDRAGSDEEGGRGDENGEGLDPSSLFLSLFLHASEEATPAVVTDTQVASSGKPVGPPEPLEDNRAHLIGGGTVGERRTAGKPSAKRKWLLGVGIAASVLLLALVGLWAGGVLLRVKTPEGTLVVEVDVPNADVYVDGRKMTVRWDEGGKKAEISVPPGRRAVKVTRDGITVHGERVEVSEGQRAVVRARLEQQPSGARNPAAAWKQGSVWTGTGEQNPGGTFDVKVTVLKRDGDAFEGRYEVLQYQNALLIKGTVSPSGAVAWKFMRVLRAKGLIVNPAGAKFEGRISGESASVPYTWADHPWRGYTTPGKLELKLKSG